MSNCKKNVLPKLNEEKHILIVENNDGSEKYTEKKWNEVVSSSISKKFKGYTC